MNENLIVEDNTIYEIDPECLKRKRVDYQFDIITPLMWLDKKETWALADELGAFDIIKNETLTCYNGVIGDGCGHCPSCKLRKKGLDAYLASKN